VAAPPSYEAATSSFSGVGRNGHAFTAVPSRGVSCVSMEPPDYQTNRVGRGNGRMFISASPRDAPGDTFTAMPSYGRGRGRGRK